MFLIFRLYRLNNLITKQEYHLAKENKVQSFEKENRCFPLQGKQDYITICPV